MSKSINKNNLNKLPETTGVYLFYEKNEIIYIGKAINIKSRVKNHFQQPSDKDILFINKITKIGFLETGSEIEALILEANLIKKYQPKFNVIWRDDKNYFYVALRYALGKLIPYIFITHQKNQENTTYIGPFVEGTALKKTLKLLRKAFPYYTTKSHPKNKCTYCHLDLCPGLNPDIVEYKKNIKKLILILKGKKSSVLTSLKKEMKNLSKEKEFEKAGKIRDKIYALEQIMAHTHVITSETKMAENFAREKFSPTWIETQKILQRILIFNKPISKIECYDVSNIQGKQATGSMVVFINGKPEKNLYRKFRIKMKNEPNDIAMLKEILQRRFNHPEWEYPELILIDGGKAQINIAIKIKSQKTNTKNIKVLAIAKKNNELFIERKDKPVLLKNFPREISNLILQLRDEAHRFAITYHKKLREKNLLKN